MISRGQLSGLKTDSPTDTKLLLSKDIRNIVELSRLYHPAPVLLIYFPHLYGALYACIRQRTPYQVALQQSLVLLVGSIFFSNASHIWNDVVDKAIDEQVPRTRTRPIPRGEVSRSRAVVLCITQAIPAISAFSYFPLHNSAIYAIPNIIATTYYPWSKRHTNYPQFVLGFCIAYGVVIGALAVGLTPFTREAGWLLVHSELLCLFLAVLFWMVISDTVYAHLDIDSDLRIGIGSTAVRFRGYARAFLAIQVFCMISSLFLLGIWENMSGVYYCFAVGGSLLSMGSLLYWVDFESSQSCWWWFGTGFWYTGTTMLIGLLLEYSLSEKMNEVRPAMQVRGQKQSMRLVSS